jgi:uncharacterized protein (TIGR02217 family)
MFSEERLDLGYDYGTVATITTKTSIIESKNGKEQRTPQWYQPLLQFNIGKRSEINNQLDQLIAFFQARKGAYEGFRFKDWSDYQFSTIITLNANKQAQLFKAYSVAGFTVKRPLIKIVPESILVSVGNSPVTTGWTVDFNTGIITFDQIQTELIQVSGEFDVPVRFATDEINLRFEAFEACEPESNLKLFSLENLNLTEIRINPTLALSLDQIPQSLDHQINLGYDYGTIGGVEFATKINQLVSGQEQKISDWTTNRGNWEVGARTLIKSDLDYLISLFRVCRGKAVGFEYFDWGTESQINVRFGEDAIAFRFDAYEQGTGRVIFNLAGVPLVGFVNNVFIGLTSGTGLAGIDPTGSRHRILEFTFNGQNLFGNLQINGNASMVAGNILQLTPAANSQAGSAFWKSALSSARINQDWSVFFVYEIIENSRYDGITFLITSSGPKSLAGGGAIGYFGIKSMVAVEFDTFKNNEYGDPNNNHIAITTDGEGFAPIILATQSSPGLDLVGQRWVWIDYVNSQLRVFIASSNSKPSSPILTHSVVLSSLL